MYYAQIDSPLGQLTLASDGAAITALHIAGDRYFTAIPASWVQDLTQLPLQQAATELAEYFAGQRRQFDVPLNAAGTPFQQEVWRVLQAIPFGSTVSYGQIATQLGRPHASRAVGTAVGRNPLCILVPCHRVLPAGGGLGGFVAGLACKQILLTLEAKA